MKPVGVRTARPWSLARRLTTLFLISTSLFVVAISATSAWFLERSVEDEVGGVVIEELDEMVAYLEPLSHEAQSEAKTEVDPALKEELKPESEALWNKRRAGLPRQIQGLAEKHSHFYRFAWRIWPPGSTEPLEDLGETQLFTPEVPRGFPKLAGGVLPLGRRWDTRVTTPSNWRILLVLDASERRQILRAYLTYALGLILASMGVALIFSRYFFVRVSGLLGQVASRAREMRSLDEPLAIEVEHAPSEIAAIANALSEMLEKVRREADKARIFTAGLAHELRSPVQNLVGETEVALLRERDPETYRRVLTSHLEELRSLGDAIDNLVTICSAGDTGRTRPRELIDLGEEAKIRLARERTQGARHQVQVELSVEGDTRLWGDREALLRAIRNLVANAVQWSPPNSKVVARVRGLPQEIEVLVEDAGPGVAPELRARIFEPFFRGPQAAGRRIGYGLGLALTRMAVDEHSGTIEVSESSMGGARFRMLLPRRAPDSDSRADSSTSLTS